ncbi:hypothetical protein BD31_I0812 [Candidatus Nitrosopumilus salaria BD31]|uniref:Uncharacterized protein n=1 Tax=Candidatus Nitrosopumilus salarius BD31 TaxID=859350 RepID=I3D214_9ARCH|nr:hypothetical protein BD31_I0812 [Candidatus Nitrosopumilus salaria BD31]
MSTTIQELKLLEFCILEKMKDIEFQQYRCGHLKNEHEWKK